MAWLAQVADILPPWVFNSIVTILISAVAGGLAWGIRPALRHLLDRLLPAWSSLAATAVQLLILLGALALIARTASMGTLFVLLLCVAAFFAGTLFKQLIPLTTQLAPSAPEKKPYYVVGDTVMLGGAYHGIVSAIDAQCTHLDSPRYGRVILSHQLIANHPIIIGQPGSEFDSNLLPVLAEEEPPTHSAPQDLDQPTLSQDVVEPTTTIASQELDQPTRPQDVAEPTAPLALQEEPLIMEPRWSSNEVEPVESSLQAPFADAAWDESTPWETAEPTQDLAMAETMDAEERAPAEPQSAAQRQTRPLSLYNIGPLKRRAMLGKQSVATLKRNLL